MHVLIDARMVTARNFGIGRYVFNLLDNLIDLDKTNRYSLIVNDDYLAELTKNASNFNLIKAKAKWLSLSGQIEVPMIIKRVKPDLFHAASFSVPFIQPCPTVATIYDLIHVIFPGHYSFIHKIYYGIFLKSVIKQAKRIITISESSRQDINKYYGYPADRIDIAYPAAGDRFRPVKDDRLIADLKAKYQLPEHIILYIGNRKKHKNVAGLIEAYSMLSKKLKDQYALVLSGLMDQELEALVRMNKVQGRVKCLSNISEEELPLAYNAADLFVFPTLYEGFGLPPLEAMACGVPVITSNVASVPEVVGDAALLVDPNNSRELADTMAKVLENNDLKQELKAKSLERARHFTWEECAQRTLKTYMEAVR